MKSRVALLFGGLGASAVVGGSFIVWIIASDAGAIRDALRWLSPRALELTFLLALGAGAASLSRVRAASGDGRLVEILGVGVLAFVAVSFLPPRTHRIYYDEDIYQNVAQNILWTGHAQMCNEAEIVAGRFRCHAYEYNKEPNGFPFLLSLGFRLTGVSETAAHRVNHVVFALGTMAVYGMGCLLFERAALARIAALIYALTPQNLLWGATVAVEPSASAFSVIGLAGWVLFLRDPSWATGLFSGAALAFACQLRPESGLVLVAAAVLTLLLAPSRLRERAPFAVALLTMLLLLPHFAHLWSVRHESWGAGDRGKFTAAVVASNSKANLAYYVEGQDFPALFTLFAVVGLAVSPRRRESAGLLAWFVLFFGVFLPFYAGSYRYGADVRFSLVSVAPLALLAGRGALWLTDRAGPRFGFLPYVLIAYAFSSFLPVVRSIGPESFMARADHGAALRMVEALPEDAILLTHNPGMIQVMGRSATQASVATYAPEKVDAYLRKYAGGVYFHFSFWCNVDDPVQNAFCTHILGTYGTEVLLDEKAGFYRYILYRLLPPLNRAR